MSANFSRRFFLAAAVVALLPSTGGWASADSTDPAGVFIHDLGNRAVRILFEKENTNFQQREAAFREIMVEGFDIATISRFVMGRHWKVANNKQRSDYTAIFLDFIVRVYASRFDAYNGEQFEVSNVFAETNGDKIVRARIFRPSGGAPIAVDFRVRPMDDHYRVVDVNVEGISMLHTHRVEFSSVINRKGIDGLLSDLRARLEATAETAVN